MTAMTLTAGIGLVMVVFLSLFFTSRAAGRRAGIQAEVETEGAAKVRLEQEANVALVRNLLAGTPVEKALAEYHRARSAILTAEGAEGPWDWGPDDLQGWKRREMQRRLEESGRRLLLPAVGSLLLVITVTATVLVILFNALSPRPASASPGPAGTLPAPSAAPLPTPGTPPFAPDPAGTPQGPGAGPVIDP